MRIMKGKSKDPTFHVIQDVKRNGKRSTEIIENLGHASEICAKYNVTDADAWADSYVQKLRENQSAQNHKCLIPFHTNSVIYQRSKKMIKRSTGVLFYDCTNYFFEVEHESGLKQYGPSKEHRPTPIVQMGLFMDKSGIPLAFCINPGNQNEQLSLKPLEQQIMRDFELSKFVVCTDAGLSSAANRRFNNYGDAAFFNCFSVKDGIISYAFIFCYSQTPCQPPQSAERPLYFSSILNCPEHLLRYRILACGLVQFLHADHLFLGIIPAEMHVCIHGHTDVGMVYQILQSLRIHPGFRHIRAIGVATDIKILMADLKRIYAAPTEEITLVESNSFEEKWAAKYHHYRVRHTPHR